MNTETAAPDQLFGYEVTDSAGNKIGSVDNVWVDDATSDLEFIGVKTGWLFGKTHVIPAANAQIDADNRTIAVPFPQDQVKDAPSFSGDSELSPDDENQIYDYYGLERSTGPSPTGEAAGTSAGAGTAGYVAADTDTDDAGYASGPAAAADTVRTGDVATDTGDRTLTLSEEQLQVGKQQVQAGTARLRKVVRTEQVEQPVELYHEEVQIERVPAGGADVPAAAFQEQEIEVPVMREEPVVGKEAHVTGQVNVNKTADTETRTVGGQVRREEVVTDDTDVAPTRSTADVEDTTGRT